jgi:predicted nucleotidyltransferase
MRPNPTDLQIARRLAARIAAAGSTRVRRVALIGSRARGDARPGSDLDLAVVLEQGPGEKPWGPEALAAERKRLQDELGPTPLPTEVYLSTTDLYAAGHQVFGGVEWLIDNEGVDVFTAPSIRRPVVRRTPDQVRRGYAATWIVHALRALEAAASGADTASGDKRSAAALCVQRAVWALLVFHRLPASTAGGLEGLLKRLGERDPAFSSWVAKLTASSVDPGAAHAVLKGAVDRIALDPASARYVAELRHILSLRRPIRGNPSGDDR